MGGAESRAPDCPPVWKGKWPKLRKDRLLGRDRWMGSLVRGL